MNAIGIGSEATQCSNLMNSGTTTISLHIIENITDAEILIQLGKLYLYSYALIALTIACTHFIQLRFYSTNCIMCV